MGKLHDDLTIISQIWGAASQQYIDHSTTVGQAFSIPVPALVDIIENTTKNLMPHYSHVSQWLTNFRSEIVAMFAMPQ